MTEGMHKKMGYEMQDTGLSKVYRKTVAPFQADVEVDVMTGKINWKVYHIRNAMGGPAEKRGKARKLPNALKTAQRELNRVAAAQSPKAAAEATRRPCREPEPPATVPTAPEEVEAAAKKATFTKLGEKAAADNGGFDYAIRVDGENVFLYRVNQAGAGYYAEVVWEIAEQLGVDNTDQVNGLYRFVADIKESAIRIALLLDGDESIELWNGVAYPNQRA